MIKSFFKAFSYIFHPLFLPLLGLYILFELPVYSFGLVIVPEIKHFMYLMFALLTIVAPGISVLILYFNKAISSLNMPIRKERFVPLFLLLVYYIIQYSFIRFKFPVLFQVSFIMPYLFGMILIVVVALILNNYIKISLHTIGFFGIIGAVTAYMQTEIFYNFTFLVGLIIFGGIIASSRIYLKAHNLVEVIYAMVFGFGIEFFCIKMDWFI
jgi:hypothetical protein